MISHLDHIKGVSEAQKALDKLKAHRKELRALNKSVSCNIRGTVYSRLVWEGTEEEFKQHVLEKYYDSDGTRKFDRKASEEVKTDKRG